jgi:hypothetical protein
VASPTPPETDPEPGDDPLAWEARNAQRAGVLALAAGAVTLLGSVISALAQSAVPEAEDRILTIADTLRLTAEGEEIPGGRLSAIAQYLGDNPVPFVLGGVLIGLGGLLAFAPLAFLFRATRHRRPGLPQIALISAAIGAVGYGVGQAITRTAYYVGAAGFGDDGDVSNSAASDALNNSGVVVGGLIAQIGQIALAVAFALVALNAMRVGLLTRFLGVLGMIVGATLILPLDQFGLIRSAWLVMAGLLILGRWPGGRPAAWATAEAVPWPTQQQLREQREEARRDRGEDRGQRDRAEQEKESVPPTRAPAPRRPDATPHPSSQKRKRKRRS